MYFVVDYGGGVGVGVWGEGVIMVCVLMGDVW